MRAFVRAQSGLDQYCLMLRRVNLWRALTLVIGSGNILICAHLEHIGTLVILPADAYYTICSQCLREEDTIVT